MRLTFGLVCLLFASLRLGVSADKFGPSGSQILSVPGHSGALPSKQYGGYLNVPGTTKQLYYIFVLSTNSPETDPVIVWLNGGPGCSSLFGYIRELGPFTYAPIGDGLLFNNVNATPNANAWNHVANVIYIDSPVGVGLSYATDPDDQNYEANDFSTASDLNAAIHVWFELHPFFQGHDFYITGESYAGVYVPMFADAVLNANDAGQEPHVNLKGYAEGNAVTDASINYNYYGAYRGFNLLSGELAYKLNSSNCYWTTNGYSQQMNEPLPIADLTYPYDYDSDDEPANALNATLCNVLADKVVSMVHNVYSYDVFRPCFWGVQTHQSYLYNATLEYLAAEGIQWEDPAGPPSYQDTCDDDERVINFLFNSPAVREAFHAAPVANASQTLAGFYRGCSANLNYTINVDSVFPYHKSNIARGLRVLVYSGDVDTSVPSVGSQLWTAELGNELGLVADWAPWYMLEPEQYGWQVEGYLTQYQGLDFMTVHGSGHYVPFYKPRQALTMISAFLADTLNSTTVLPTTGGNFVDEALFPANDSSSKLQFSYSDFNFAASASA
ncbi:hypothetical protein WJX73_006115 [Symbiochloris irregularis]|uniref:Carboxypeptidase n=1 Tax=Symbiochloris irregularis TaxID=706552 RepID=A0AAW1PIC3_9CHLO